MSRSATKVIGITLGDPAGIGPEVVAKALKRIKRSKGVRYFVIGDEYSFKRYFPVHSGHVDLCGVKEQSPSTLKPGRPNHQSAALSFRFLTHSVELLKNKIINAVVTAPLSKEFVSEGEPGFCGHTEYYAQMFGVKKFDMMFVTPHLKSIIVTRHVPVYEIAKLLTRTKVLESITLAHESLQSHFRIKRPRIAVCGLNPHAGEGGKIGREEIKVIIPAMDAARKIGIDVHGPFAGDTMFVPERSKGYDVIISMYHDQGLIAMKTLYFRTVVNLTVGLPFIRTSPAHGTAYDIAGQNKADASSMIHAINLAVKLS
jgi:4-hydroxythreonine-4-phosphate dehydrogenase